MWRKRTAASRTADNPARAIFMVVLRGTVITIVGTRRASAIGFVHGNSVTDGPANLISDTDASDLDSSFLLVSRN
jgi:hypothetical protein